MTSTLNSEKIEPLYKQLKDVLLKAICSQELKHFQKIPSEAELARTYSISRITVRNAISELVEEGVLIKKQGKGTFVSGATLERDFHTIVGYSESMKQQGYRPGRIILEKRIVLDDPDHVKSKLQLKEMDQLIHIRRLLLADDEPLIFENTYYPIKYSFLLEQDLSNISMYQLLQETMGVTPFKALRTIGISYADSMKAELLNIKENMPLLVVHEHVFEQNGDPLHYSISYAISSKTNIRVLAIAPTSDEQQGYIMIPSES